MGSEIVLVLQGGGSLGAYECGIYRTLAKHNMKFDIITGTSIGAVNASIITCTQDNNNSAEILEHFCYNACLWINTRYFGSTWDIQFPFMIFHISYQQGLIRYHFDLILVSVVWLAILHKHIQIRQCTWSLVFNSSIISSIASD